MNNLIRYPGTREANPPAEAPRTRLVLTFEGAKIVNSEIIGPDQYVMSVECFLELLTREGYRVIPPRRV